jgi:hypothetical protein
MKSRIFNYYTPSSVSHIFKNIKLQPVRMSNGSGERMEARTYIIVSWSFTFSHITSLIINRRVDGKQ